MKRREVGGRFTRREDIYLEDSDFDEDWNLKEEVRRQLGSPFEDQTFLAHAERLTARARALLRDGGFPDCRGVSFSYRSPEEWEACEDTPDSVKSPRRWLPLDFYLRRYRWVKDDAPADLAARIVCKDYILRRGRNDDADLWLDAAMWLAYEIGKLEDQFNVYSQVGSEHENLNKRRWAKRDEAREKVRRDLTKELEKDPSRFHSAAKAGEYYSDWLAKGKPKYQFEPDAVEDWIRGFGILLKKPAKI